MSGTKIEWAELACPCYNEVWHKRGMELLGLQLQRLALASRIILDGVALVRNGVHAARNGIRSIYLAEILVAGMG